MIRLLAYLGSIFLVMILLRFVPVIGWWFRIPLIGFFTSAVIVAFVGKRWAEGVVARRRLENLKRQLGGVETPHNQGKLGSLLEASGHFRSAIPHLEAATEGEPQVAEWHWRLGHCLLETRAANRAVGSLLRAAELDERIGYGAALMHLSEALRQVDEFERALTVLERVERNHGPSPESAFRRGRVLRGLGRKEEAGRAFSKVGELADEAAKYQQGENRQWVWRSIWVRMFG